METLVVACAVQVANVTRTVYVPALAVVEAGIVGSCKAETNPAGPVHEYVPPPPEVKFIVAPTQNGPVLLATGTGNGFTVTFVVVKFVQPAAFVTVKV